MEERMMAARSDKAMKNCLTIIIRRVVMGQRMMDECSDEAIKSCLTMIRA
jgi:hypothetical protein